jgi:putative FmdB family regulatory protein
MPTYAYRGTACAHEFEAYQSFSENPLTTCTECGGPVRRVIQPAPIVFKGSGWYINDSRKGSTSNQASTSDTSSSTKSETSPIAEPVASTAAADKAAAD